MIVSPPGLKPPQAEKRQVVSLRRLVLVDVHLDVERARKYGSSRHGSNHFACRSQPSVIVICDPASAKRRVMKSTVSGYSNSSSNHSNSILGSTRCTSAMTAVESLPPLKATYGLRALPSARLMNRSADSIFC